MLLLLFPFSCVYHICTLPLILPQCQKIQSVSALTISCNYQKILSSCDNNNSNNNKEYRIIYYLVVKHLTFFQLNLAMYKSSKFNLCCSAFINTVIRRVFVVNSVWHRFTKKVSAKNNHIIYQLPYLGEVVASFTHMHMKSEGNRKLAARI